jgi:hypothetical protein
MTTVALNKPGDLRMFAISIAVAIAVFALSFLALRYAAPAAAPGVPLVPCRQCGQGCPCPRLAGASLCGCPR